METDGPSAVETAIPIWIGMGRGSNVMGFFKGCQTLIWKKRSGSLRPRNRHNPEPQAAVVGILPDAKLRRHFHHRLCHGFHP